MLTGGSCVLAAMVWAGLHLSGVQPAPSSVAPPAPITHSPPASDPPVSAPSLPAPATPTATQGPKTAGATPTDTTATSQKLPPARNAFAGSSICRDCHTKKYSRWTHDWHRRALSRPEPEFVVGRFRGNHYKGDSSEAWTRHDRQGYWMRTQDTRGALSDFPVQWLIGGKRMQDTVTIFPDGRWQVLPVYFHVTGRGEWVDYNEAKQGRVGPDHPFFWTNFRRNANHECLDCHVTGLRVHYEQSTHHLSTEFVDDGVACESCHGPGARHAETEEPEDIVNPAKLDPERALAVCAQCHGPRNPLFPLLDAEHRFQPGQRYEDSYQPVVVVTGRERSGDFFSDGRPKTSSFEYQALLQSRCYLRGQATCLTCHTAPHDEHEPDELKPAGAPSRAAVAENSAWGGARQASETVLSASCRTCHQVVFAEGSAHTHHRAAAANSCIACHMPRVVSGVLDKFSDHAFDVPAPENTVRHGIPNACGGCHKAESPAALGQALRRLWPGAERRQQRRLVLADAIDERTAAASLPALLQVVADESEAPSLRGACAVLLAQRFPREAVPAITPLLRVSDPSLRARAVEALSSTDPRNAAAAIASRLDDPSLMVRHLAAIVLGSVGEPRAEEALRSLVKAPATSSLWQPHWALGVLHLRRGDLEGAVAEFERTVELVPYFTEAQVALADAYARGGHLEQARARLEEALYFDPRHPGAKERMGWLSR